MKKLILNSGQRETIKEFLEILSDAIIRAEIATLGETSVSSHRPRLYIFTTHGYGMSEIETIPNNIYETIKSAISNYKRNESIEDSRVVAILCFLPSRALKIDLNNLDVLPKELQDRLMNQSLTPSDIVENPKYKNSCKHLVDDVLSMSYVSFYCNRGQVYKVIEHDDEVIDLPIYSQYGFGDDSSLAENSGIAKLSNLIEVE